MANVPDRLQSVAQCEFTTVLSDLRYPRQMPRPGLQWRTYQSTDGKAKHPKGHVPRLQLAQERECFATNPPRPPRPRSLPNPRLPEPGSHQRSKTPRFDRRQVPGNPWQLVEFPPSEPFDKTPEIPIVRASFPGMWDGGSVSSFPAPIGSSQSAGQGLPGQDPMTPGSTRDLR